MNLGQLRTAVRGLSGDTSGAQFADADILTYLNWGQTEISRLLGITQITTANTTLDAGATEGVGGLLLPTNFLQEVNVLWSGQKLRRMDYATYYQAMAPLTVGTETPSFYTISGYDGTAQRRRMLFYPYQTINRTGLSILLTYIPLTTDMSADADVPILPTTCDEALVLYALGRCKMQENDMQGYQMVMRDYDMKLLRLAALMQEADAFGYTVIRDESDGDWYPVLSG